MFLFRTRQHLKKKPLVFYLNLLGCVCVHKKSSLSSGKSRPTSEFSCKRVLYAFAWEHLNISLRIFKQLVVNLELLLISFILHIEQLHICLNSVKAALFSCNLKKAMKKKLMNQFLYNAS